MNESCDLILQRIALNLKRIRNEKSLTQQNMAEIGFNYRYYQKIESGEQNMNVATLSRLADALGVDISEFFRKV